MSFLQKLLAGTEVKWKTLGEIAKVQRGASPRPIAQYITDDVDGVPWIKIGDTSSGSKYVKNTAQKITIEGAKKSRVLKKGDFIISNSMSFGRPYILDINGAIHDGWASISNFEEKLNSNFLYHYLSSNGVQNYWLSKINSGSVSNLNADIIKTLLIPIPCPENTKKSLEIQSEIVRILDVFSVMTAKLTAELTAELSIRKKQYNYYRDQLLSFEEGEVEWKPLEDVFDIFAGGDVPKDALSDSETEEFNIPILSNGIEDKSLYGWTNKAKIEKPSLTISARGTIGWTSFRTRPFFPIVRLLVLTPKIKLNLKYAYYFMKTIENNYKLPEAGIPQLTKPMIKDIQIPLPCPNDPEKSLAEQDRIVAILDKFDPLTSSIIQGLSREIELRQKQYEYYRDLLLSFPKPEGVEV
ncbi:restriction endonuclease subunit S [Acinetobacter baumannii]|uniref:restriction endonuclease subunit S n=1 Tax=Acinetobacter baumannii TaxID=470 RepID=UPI000BA10034|nr:restriction endonuclease subunit S [Acinetobacter baumannii]OZT30152.1 restriction endonuclease [Acinetobacter baumannii]